MPACRAPGWLIDAEIQRQSVELSVGWRLVGRRPGHFLHAGLRRSRRGLVDAGPRRCLKCQPRIDEPSRPRLSQRRDKLFKQPGLPAGGRTRERMAGVDGRHAGSVADRSRRLYPLRGSAVRPRRRSAGRALAVSQRRLCDRTGDGAFLLHALILLSDLRGLPAERAHRSPLEAGLATLPFAVGYFASSLASSHVMQRLGVRAPTLGFALEVLGFGVVMLAVGNVLADSLELGLVVGGHQSRPRRHRSASRARLGYRDLDLPDRRGARRRRDRRRILRRTRDEPRPRRLCACLQRRARVQRRPARPRRAPLAMARGRSIRRRTCGARAEVSLAATRPFSRNYRVSFQECSPPLSP